MDQRRVVLSHRTVDTAAVLIVNGPILVPAIGIDFFFHFVDRALETIQFSVGTVGFRLYRVGLSFDQLDLFLDVAD